jgi:hypothetical protein
LISIPYHPSILNITSAIITARKYLIAHSTGTLTTPRAMTGKQKKQRNKFPHNKKLVQEPEGNEENRYSDSDSSKMKINYAKEPNEAQNNLKKDILQVLNENFVEMILDMVNQNEQETHKKFQDNKNREFEKAKEEIKKTKKYTINTKVKQRTKLIRR